MFVASIVVDLDWICILLGNLDWICILLGKKELWKIFVNVEFAWFNFLKVFFFFLEGWMLLLEFGNLCFKAIKGFYCIFMKNIS